MFWCVECVLTLWFQNVYIYFFTFISLYGLHTKKGNIRKICLNNLKGRKNFFFFSSTLTRVMFALGSVYLSFDDHFLCSRTRLGWINSVFWWRFYWYYSSWNETPMVCEMNSNKIVVFCMKNGVFLRWKFQLLLGEFLDYSGKYF